MFAVSACDLPAQTVCYAPAVAAITKCAAAGLVDDGSIHI